MNQIEILIKQTEDAYDWTNKLINSIPYDKWENIPQIIESNITWQVGHLLVSFYYHSIMVIVGHQMDIIQKMPLKEYSNLFTDAAPGESIGKTTPEELKDHLIFMECKSIDIIKSLSIDDLESKLESTTVPHPIAKNKFEALDWNVKHTMWHCGQLGILRRIIGEKYNFGLHL